MNIKLLVMDVDGTLTDGKIYIGNEGEVLKAFNAKDGYGIVMLRKKGVVPVIITGRKSRIVETRAKELGIDELYQGIMDKLSQLESVAEKYGVKSSQIAYIGDDLNDLDCIRHCGLTACPNDAVDTLKSHVDYVCEKDGGSGAVREFIDWICLSCRNI